MSYTITFDTIGLCFPPSPQTVNSGGTVTKPTEPTSEGYVFLGWYTSRTYVTKWNFSTAVTQSMTLYARWQITEEERTIDWTKSMQRTYEFYKVDANTWKDEKLLDYIESCSIERDLSTDTLGSASFSCSDVFEECYIRVYMIANQNGFRYKICLGTYLVQAPAIKSDGKRKSIDMDGYTSLIELKNSIPPIGYTILKNETIMDKVYQLTIENSRAPVTNAQADKTLYYNFTANLDDTWFSYLADLMANADYSFSIDEYGQIIFEPHVSINALRPVWTYTDDNSSILLPDISDERDLYSIPNVVEVIYSTETMVVYSKVENNSEDSPISIPNRGRRVAYRDVSPNISEDFASMSVEARQAYLDEYAEELLKSLSSLEHTVTYSHGYCPVRIGDGVLLNYKSAGLTNIKAKVISQSFKCDSGCTVEETAVYTTTLWG